MATNEDDRKNSEPPVKLIAKIEDLGVLNSLDDAKRNGETGGGDTKATKKAIIVEKSTGAPLVTVRSRRSIMESRFRLTLKTWDDVWRSTSWAKNPPKQIKMAAANQDDGGRSDRNAAGELQNGRLASVGGADAAQVSDLFKAARDNGVDNEEVPPPQSSKEEALRKSVSDTNVTDQESSVRPPMLHIATDEDIAVREREASSSIVGEDGGVCESAPDQVARSTNVLADTMAKERDEGAAGVDVVDGVGVVQDAVSSLPSSSPLPKKIKNTRFMVVPSVQVPVTTLSEVEDTVEGEEAAGTAASSDSEDASSSNHNSASRNRVPMFESRLNELTMVESQLKKLDFKPMHLELPEDRDSDDSANSKTITAAEGKTLKIRDAIPPRRNNSLEGAYPPQSKKKLSKGGAGVADVSKPSWGWLSIFRRKPSAQQIASSTSTTMSSSSKMSPTPAPASTGQGRSGTNSAGRSTSGHQARSRQQQRQTTTVASARRAAAAASAQQQNSQANARIVLIQVTMFPSSFVTASCQLVFQLFDYQFDLWVFSFERKEATYDGKTRVY